MCETIEPRIMDRDWDNVILRLGADREICRR